MRRCVCRIRHHHHHHQPLPPPSISSACNESRMSVGVFLPLRVASSLPLAVLLVVTCGVSVSSHGWGGFANTADTDNIFLVAGAGDGCFCQLSGVLDDCSCDVESIDEFNNYKLFPKLWNLLEKDYFRYYRVNLKRPCPFWHDDSHCSIQDCHVKSCKPSEVPSGIKGGEHNKYLEDINVWAKEQQECEEARKLGAIDNTISDQSKVAFIDWARYDDSLDNFCEIDDETSPDMEYVDLRLNPERYTGYKGPSAWRIWNCIYEENCFKPRSVYRPLNPLMPPNRGEDDGEGFYTWLEGLCLEKRVFYRLISGLHSSINIHLSAQYLVEDGYSKAHWAPNVNEFRKRFDPSTTRGQGTRWLRNLYFLYLIELRAISKVAPFFLRPSSNLYTGNAKEDHQTKELLLQILQLAKEFPMHFDETAMFSGNEKEAQLLKEEFRLHFKNISRIMDCVGCDKCRLWGKLQTQGLGTALKILFSEREIRKLPKQGPYPPFQLTRQEIVALINAFGRVSTSVKELQNFKEVLKDSM